MIERLRCACSHSHSPLLAERGYHCPGEPNSGSVQYNRAGSESLTRRPSRQEPDSEATSLASFVFSTAIDLALESSMLEISKQSPFFSP